MHYNGKARQENYSDGGERTQYNSHPNSKKKKKWKNGMWRLVQEL